MPVAAGGGGGGELSLLYVVVQCSNTSKKKTGKPASVTDVVNRYNLMSLLLDERAFVSDITKIKDWNPVIGAS